MKKIKRLIIVLLLLVILAVVGVYFYIDTIAKTGIEKGATYALGVDTTVDNVSVGVFSGKFGIDKLKVANPTGYTGPHFLDLGRGDIEVTLGSLMGDKVTVPRLTFKNIDVHLEKIGDKANYDVILENLRKLESKDDTTKEKESGNSKKFTIDVIEIQNVTVHVDLKPSLGGVISLGDAKKLDVVIPSLTLKNVGSDSDNGALMAEVTDVLIKAIMKAVIAKGGLPAEILGDLQGKLAQLESIDKLGLQMADKVIGDVTKEVGKTIDNATKDVTKDLLKDAGKGVTKDLGKGIGDIFGKDKK